MNFLSLQLAWVQRVVRPIFCLARVKTRLEIRWKNDSVASKALSLSITLSWRPGDSWVATISTQKNCKNHVKSILSRSLLQDFCIWDCCYCNISYPTTDCSVVSIEYQWHSVDRWAEQLFWLVCRPFPLAPGLGFIGFGLCCGIHKLESSTGSCPGVSIKSLWFRCSEWWTMIKSMKDVMEVRASLTSLTSFLWWIPS